MRKRLRPSPATRRPLDLFLEFTDRYAVASTLAHLGAVYRTIDDPDAAREAWPLARDILDELDQSAADQIRTQLHRLAQSEAAAALFAGHAFRQP